MTPDRLQVQRDEETKMWFMAKIINKNEKVDLVLGHTEIYLR